MPLNTIPNNVDRQSGGVTDGRNMTNGSFTSGLDGVRSTFGSAVSSVRSLGRNLADRAGNLIGGGTGVSGRITTQPAGQLDDPLSQSRAANLPKNGEQFSKISSEINLEASSPDDWRVRINTNWSLFDENEFFGRLEETGGVVFPFMPEITFSTAANYTNVEPVHSNYAIPVYKNSVVNDITITGEFSAETEIDAEYWIAATTFFKTATKMFTGQSVNAGNPPVICSLSGYGTGIFSNVPVVIKSFEMQLPKDVNYIRYESINWNTGSFDAVTWVPVLSTISITVQPIYNRERLRKFSLQDYARGGLVTPDSKKIGFI